MAEFYFEKIKTGEMTIDQVPDLWKNEVKNLLKK